MNINIKDKDLELKYGFRAMIVYEEITGESFSIKGMKDLIVFFYSVVVATDTNLDLDFDAFLDWMDDNPETLNEFSEWVINHGKKNGRFRNGENVEDESGEGKKKS